MPAAGFQVKAQDMPRKAILEEMAPGGVVIESIANLARSGGAHVIVSSKGSLSDTALKNRRAAMRDALAGLPAAPSLGRCIRESGHATTGRPLPERQLTE